MPAVASVSLSDKLSHDGKQLGESDDPPSPLDADTKPRLTNVAPRVGCATGH
jgi:hypothetical protein